MFFGEVVGDICVSRGPRDVELALVNTVFEPVESHVNGFWATLFDGAVEDAIGGAVVSF